MKVFVLALLIVAVSTAPAGKVGKVGKALQKGKALTDKAPAVKAPPPQKGKALADKAPPPQKGEALADKAPPPQKGEALADKVPADKAPPPQKGEALADKVPTDKAPADETPAGKADEAQPRFFGAFLPIFTGIIKKIPFVGKIVGGKGQTDPGTNNNQQAQSDPGSMGVEGVPANQAPDGSRLLDPILGKVNKLPAVGGVVSKLIGGGDGGQGQGLGGLVGAGGENPVKNVLINIMKAILGLLSLPGLGA